MVVGWDSSSIPTIAELRPNVFQVVIPHVLHFKHETVLVCICCFSNVVEDFFCEIFAFLLGLAEVDDARAF